MRVSAEASVTSGFIVRGVLLIWFQNTHITCTVVDKSKAEMSENNNNYNKKLEK